MELQEPPRIASAAAFCVFLAEKRGTRISERLLDPPMTFVDSLTAMSTMIAELYEP
jgi:hypothetical protein